MSEQPQPTHSGRALTPDQRYWQLWRAGRRPDLATFLAGLSAPSPGDVASVVAIDQYERWLAGDRVRAEAYVALLPSGEGRDQAACDVVYGEYLLREQLGESPSPDEYRHRFPDLAGALDRQLDLHHALAEPSRSGAPSTSGAQPPPIDEPPTIPGYEIFEEIGRGGMGVVYRARQLSLDRDVALKVLRVRPGRDAAALERTRREAHLTARLSHPNVVTVFDAGMSGEWFYIAMEYVAGIDLHRLVEQFGPLPPARATAYLRQAALGLQYAHEQGLVHRDIKPSNLIVTLGKDEGGRMKDESQAPEVLSSSFILPPSSFQRSVLKVLDLGLARAGGVARQGEQITQIGAFMGTPEFVAPEQANDPRAADVRSDLYSLGCTFYYVLTGRAPFGGATPLAKLMGHQLHDTPRLEEVPAGLSAILHKLMAKQPAQRFQTPTELVAALDVLSGAARAEAPSGVRAVRVRRLTGPDDWVKCVAFSPDGAFVAAGSVDRTLRLWDVRTGAEAWRGEAHSSAVLCLAFERTEKARGGPGDGRLVTGGQDRAVCLWEVKGGKARQLWRATGHSHNVNAVCFLAGGRILSASHDATLRVWDAETGRELAVWGAHAGPVWGVAASADGRLALSGGQDRIVRLWEVRAHGGSEIEPRAQPAAWPEQDAVISCVALSADGRLAVIGGGDGGAKLWDVAARREVAVLRGHQSRVTAAAFSPDGRHVLTGGRDRTARLFDTAGTALASLADHSWWVTAVAWHPGGEMAATGSGDRSVCLWRLEGR
jgi:serine/threonine protein kinase